MSTVLGLDEDAVRRAVTAVRPATDAHELAAVFARSAWTGIVEPSDGTAGALVGALGPEGALAHLIDDGGAALPAEMRTAWVEALARWRPRLDSGTALAALRNASRLGLSLLVPGDPGWPAGLDDLGVHGPLALWVRGEPDRMRALDRSVALVGARAPSKYGELNAAVLAGGLAERGFAVVSGGAYGVDGLAHRSTLATGGTTVAVLAGGLDRFYPSGHIDLLERVAATGAVVSELPPGFSPTKQRFLKRNRLIAAMSRATVVVEAGNRSGSINTAGHAAELGRPLGTVPGSIHSASSAGCHRLLREYDAVCIRSVDDVVELALGEPAEPLALDDLADPAERAVLDALTRFPKPAAQVARLAGLGEREAAAALELLALTGAARSGARGWVRA